MIGERAVRPVPGGTVAAQAARERRARSVRAPCAVVLVRGHGGSLPDVDRSGKAIGTDGDRIAFLNGRDASGQPAWRSPRLASQGTMTAAADLLGVTPGAISQQISVLESRLGVVLVRKAGRGVQLTDAGPRARAARRPDPRCAGRGAGRHGGNPHAGRGQGDDRALRQHRLDAARCHRRGRAGPSWHRDPHPRDRRRPGAHCRPSGVGGPGVRPGLLRCTDTARRGGDVHSAARRALRAGHVRSGGRGRRSHRPGRGAGLGLDPAAGRPPSTATPCGRPAVGPASSPPSSTR